jgi:hypothetical protein
MGHCRFCPLRRVCHDLGGYCLMLNYLAVVGLLVFLGYMFFKGLSP